MNLDILAGILSGWLAIWAFTLHIVSSPRQHNWMTIPEYVRKGFLITGAMFTWRSVNFFSVSDNTKIVGHINPEGMMALVAITYTVSSVGFWVFTSLLPDKGWQRLEWLRGVLRSRPSMAPIVLTREEISQVARADGIPTIGANEGGEALKREATRGKSRT